MIMSDRLAEETTQFQSYHNDGCQYQDQDREDGKE